MKSTQKSIPFLRTKVLTANQDQNVCIQEVNISPADTSTSFVKDIRNSPTKCIPKHSYVGVQKAMSEESSNKKSKSPKLTEKDSVLENNPKLSVAGDVLHNLKKLAERISLKREIHVNEVVKGDAKVQQVKSLSLAKLPQESNEKWGKQVPDVTTKKAVESNSTNQEAMESKAMNKKAIKSDVTSQVALESGVTGQEGIMSNVTSQEPLESNATNQKAIESNATSQDALESNCNSQKAIESNVTSQKAVKSNATSQDALESNATSQNAIESNVTSEKAIESNISADGSAVKKEEGSKGATDDIVDKVVGETDSNDLIKSVLEVRETAGEPRDIRNYPRVVVTSEVDGFNLNKSEMKTKEKEEFDKIENENEIVREQEAMEIASSLLLGNQEESDNDLMVWSDLDSKSNISEKEQRSDETHAWEKPSGEILAPEKNVGCLGEDVLEGWKRNESSFLDSKDVDAVGENRDDNLERNESAAKGNSMQDSEEDNLERCSRFVGEENSGKNSDIAIIKEGEREEKKMDVSKSIFTAAQRLIEKFKLRVEHERNNNNSTGKRLKRELPAERARGASADLGIAKKLSLDLPFEKKITELKTVTQADQRNVGTGGLEVEKGRKEAVTARKSIRSSRTNDHLRLPLQLQKSKMQSNASSNGSTQKMKRAKLAENQMVTPKNGTQSKKMMSDGRTEQYGADAMNRKEEGKSNVNMTATKEVVDVENYGKRQISSVSGVCVGTDFDKNRKQEKRPLLTNQVECASKRQVMTVKVSVKIMCDETASYTKTVDGKAVAVKDKCMQVITVRKRLDDMEGVKNSDKEGLKIDSEQVEEGSRTGVALTQSSETSALKIRERKIQRLRELIRVQERAIRRIKDSKKRTTARKKDAGNFGDKAMGKKMKKTRQDPLSDSKGLQTGCSKQGVNGSAVSVMDVASTGEDQSVALAEILEGKPNIIGDQLLTERSGTRHCESIDLTKDEPTPAPGEICEVGKQKNTKAGARTPSTVFSGSVSGLNISNVAGLPKIVGVCSLAKPPQGNKVAVGRTVADVAHKANDYKINMTALQAGGKSKVQQTPSEKKIMFAKESDVASPNYDSEGNTQTTMMAGTVIMSSTYNASTSSTNSVKKIGCSVIQNTLYVPTSTAAAHIHNIQPMKSLQPQDDDPPLPYIVSASSYADIGKSQKGDSPLSSMNALSAKQSSTSVQKMSATRMQQMSQAQRKNNMPIRNGLPLLRPIAYPKQTGAEHERVVLLQSGEGMCAMVPLAKNDIIPNALGVGKTQNNAIIISGGSNPASQTPLQTSTRLQHPSPLHKVLLPHLQGMVFKLNPPSNCSTSSTTVTGALHDNYSHYQDITFSKERKRINEGFVSLQKLPKLARIQMHDPVDVHPQLMPVGKCKVTESIPGHSNEVSGVPHDKNEEQECHNLALNERLKQANATLLLQRAPEWKPLHSQTKLQTSQGKPLPNDDLTKVTSLALPKRCEVTTGSNFGKLLSVPKLCETNTMPKVVTASGAKNGTTLNESWLKNKLMPSQKAHMKEPNDTSPYWLKQASKMKLPDASRCEITSPVLRGLSRDTNNACNTTDDNHTSESSQDCGVQTVKQICGRYAQGSGSQQFKLRFGVFENQFSLVRDKKSKRLFLPDLEDDKFIESVGLEAVVSALKDFERRRQARSTLSESRTDVQGGLFEASSTQEEEKRKHRLREDLKRRMRAFRKRRKALKKEKMVDEREEKSDACEERAPCKNNAADDFINEHSEETSVKDAIKTEIAVELSDVVPTGECPGSHKEGATGGLEGHDIETSRSVVTNSGKPNSVSNQSELGRNESAKSREDLNPTIKSNESPSKQSRTEVDGKSNGVGESSKEVQAVKKWKSANGFIVRGLFVGVEDIFL